MRTVIITGASSGLGAEFTRQLLRNYPDTECVWLIARRKDKLEEAAKPLSLLHVELLPLDLCDPANFGYLEEKLRLEQPNVTLLVNNAGCGYLGRVGELSTRQQTQMVDLNVRALTALTNLVVPYMRPGAHIINVSSVAAFCPTARMGTYSASKAYVSSFTLSVSEELKKRQVGVTAVCPGPIRTEFLDLAGITADPKTFRYLPYCDQVRVVEGTYQAAKAGRVFYTPKLFYKAYRGLAKLVPHQILVKFIKR